MYCDVLFETIRSSGCSLIPSIVPHASFVMSRSASTFCVTITFIPIVMSMSLIFFLCFFVTFSCTSRSQTELLPKSKWFVFSLAMKYRTRYISWKFMQGLLIPQMLNSMPQGDKGCAVPRRTCEVGWGEFGLVIISIRSVVISSSLT